MQPAESFTVVAFRAFVMLACLVLVPLAAVFGSQCPEVVKSLLVDKVMAWIHAADSAADGSSGAKLAAAKTAQRTAPGAPLATAAASSAQRRAPAVRSATLDEPRAVPAKLAGHTAPPANEPLINDRSRGTLVRDGRSDAAAAREAPVPASEHGWNDGPETRDERVQPAPAESSNASDPFAAIERKLRDYGATYYLLEAWGHDREMYRFHCKMPLGGAARDAQNFEAFDRDAVRAMTQVVEQIELWRTRGGRN